MSNQIEKMNKSETYSKQLVMVQISQAKTVRPYSNL